MSSVINTIYLELEPDQGEGHAERRSPYAGSKRIELVVGDIAEARADLVIASSSVKQFPGGAVIKSLRRYHSIALKTYDLYPLKRYTTSKYPKSNMGVWLLREDLPTGQDLIVVAMTPDAGFQDGFVQPFQGLLEVLTALDEGTLHISDLRVQRLEPPYSVALPILGGARTFEPKERMRVLIEGLEKLIKGSRHIEVISLYVYDKSEAENLWSRELERLLARDHSKELPFKEDCEHLQRELLHRVKGLHGVRNLDLPHLKHEVLVPLRTHLTYDPPCVATLSTFGRKSWEAVTLYYLRFIDDPKVQKSGLTGVFDKLLSTFLERGMLSSWVALSVTKELGNAAAHVQGELGVNPLETTDYPILLFALEQVLGLVDPFSKMTQASDLAFYEAWTGRLEERCAELLLELDAALSLSPLRTLKLKQRKEHLDGWLRAYMSSSPEHAYWLLKRDAQRDLGGVRTLISDQLPKWVTIHLWIWSRQDLTWAEVEPSWVRLYDALTRWRLLEHAAQRAL